MHSLDIESLKWSKYLEISWFTRPCVIWLWRAFTVSLWTALSDSQLWSRQPPFVSSNTSDSSLTDGFPGSGLLPLPSIWVSESHSVVFESLQPHGLYSPWNSPGQNTGVGCRSPSSGDHPNPEIEPMSPALQAILYQLSYKGSPRIQDSSLLIFWVGNGNPLQYCALQNSMDCMGSQRVRYYWATFTTYLLSFFCLPCQIRWVIRRGSHGALIYIGCSNINGIFSYEGPDSKYFQLYGSYSFCYIYSILLL